MNRIIALILILFTTSTLYAQKENEQNKINGNSTKILELNKKFKKLDVEYSEKQNENSVKLSELNEKIQRLETEYRIINNNYNNLNVYYQQTNDRLDNYLTYTAIVASIFGVLIALAGIYIGFQGLESQKKTKNAIKTLEEAKSYVNNKKIDFDNLIENKKQLLHTEYNNIIELLKSKLLNDIEIETSKVKEIAELKSDEIQKISVEQQNNKTIELLEKRLEFFEDIGIPDDPEILFSKAQILIEKKKHAEAIMLLEKIVLLVPEHKKAFWYLGYEYAELNDIEKSIENYKKSLKINPNNTSALNNIALGYLVKGNYLDALENIDKAIELSNKDERYYNNRIRILKALNSNTRAINDYIQLISINPNNKKYYNDLIALFKIEKKHNEILLYYDKAINHFEGDETGDSNKFSLSKANYLGANGKEEIGIEILQGLIDKNYEIEICYMNIAKFKNGLGKTDEAISILNNGISSNPLSSSLYLYKAFIELGESEEKARATINMGGKAINNENYFFAGGRLFHQKENNSLSEYCYENVLNIIEQKLKKGKIEEGDLVNFYEVLIILQKSLSEFNKNYRMQIVSEKYVFVLNLLDILNRVIASFNNTEKNEAIKALKELNIEEKDKGFFIWNFGDIMTLVEKKQNKDLTDFISNVILYAQKKIEFNELK